jgi:hypothetical protein
MDRKETVLRIEVDRKWIRIMCPMAGFGVSGEPAGSATRKFVSLLLQWLSKCGRRAHRVPRGLVRGCPRLFLSSYYKLETKKNILNIFTILQTLFI